MSPKPVRWCGVCGGAVWTRGECERCRPPRQLRYQRRTDRRALSEILREERLKRRAELDPPQLEE